MSTLKYHFLRLLGSLLTIIPWQLDRILFRAIYPFYLLSHKKEYNRIAFHLEQADIKPRPPVWQVYENLFVNGMDSLRYLRNRAEIQKRVHLANRSLLQNALNSNNPVVVVSIHGGAFEMLHRSLESFGRPIHLITSEFRDTALTRYLRTLRATRQVKIYNPSEAPQVMRHLLRKKGILALMLDQSRDPQGNVVEMLGRKTRLFFRLPQEANKLGATIITFRTMRRGNTHLIRFESLYPPQTHPKELERGLTREIERWILENPEQWTWNYPGNWNLSR